MNFYDIVLCLDNLEGNDLWRFEEECPDYDWSRIKTEFNQIKHLMEQKDTKSLMRYLQSRLIRNVGNILTPCLYENSLVGTKILIDNYLEIVKKALHFIAEYEDPDITIGTKLCFFNECRHSMKTFQYFFSIVKVLGY